MTGKPADRVEARGEIDDAVGCNEAVRCADAVDAAIAGRQADGAAAIRAKREVKNLDRESKGGRNRSVSHEFHPV
jgi:hypothetical protein